MNTPDMMRAKEAKGEVSCFRDVRANALIAERAGDTEAEYHAELQAIESQLLEQLGGREVWCNAVRSIAISPSQEAIDWDKDSVQMARVAHYCNDPRPRGVVVGLVTPGHFGWLQRGEDGVSARAPYLVLRVDSGGLLYAVPVAETTGMTYCD